MAEPSVPGYTSGERDGFLRDLRHFHEVRGTPFRHLPKLNGREVDLFMLYNLCTDQGGWFKVNLRNSWSEFFEPLEIPDNCVNASVALKQIYLRYLSKWEKVHFPCDDGDRIIEEDEEMRHKRGAPKLLHNVPSHYNYHQHNISESAREYNNLSTELHKPTDYDRLGLSLLSPLPNEQDFAINVCTLLSNDGKHTLKLEKHPILLDYLLAHAGVFNHSSLRNVLADSYGSIRKQNITGFWRDTLDTEEFLDLTNENLYLRDASCRRRSCRDVVPIVDLTRFHQDGSLNLDVDYADPLRDIVEVDLIDAERVDLLLTTNGGGATDTSECVTNTSRSNKRVKLKLNTDATDRELFNLGRNLGTRDYMGQRVLQVATILRNLSFFEENVPVLVRNTTFVRFTLLCACSKWNQLMNLGLEMLGNLAAEFLVRDVEQNRIAGALMKIVTRGLHTDDRNWCITALEVLNKLSQNEANEDALLRCLEVGVYERVCSFLTIHDVMLLIYTLECLYSLSSLGERACNYIVNIYGAVDTLVSLVTVEGKSYGPKACIGMKLVETVSGTPNNAPQTQASGVQTISAQTPATTAVSTPAIVSPTAPAAIPVQNAVPAGGSSAAPTKIAAPSTPVRHVGITPQRLITSTATTSTVTAASTTSQANAPVPLQQKLAHQQTFQENEQFALTWLRATYELHTTGKVEHQELYKHYINSCAKIGRRGVIAPLHFPRCVRSVFGGTVGPNPEKPVNNEPQYYDGIKVRVQPLAVNVLSATTQVTSAAASTMTTTTAAAPVADAACPTTPAAKVVVARRAPPPCSSLLPEGGGDAAVSTITTPQPPASPASILKAQLSAPPKPRECAAVSAKADVAKSQVMAHPHLSQALLGSGCSNTNPAQSNPGVAGPGVGVQGPKEGQSSTSLIKSLLATKVNDCMTAPVMSMRTDCQSVAQVVARQQQQRLLAQQNQQQQMENKGLKIDGLKNVRLNGARQLFVDSDVADPAVSSTTQSLNAKTRREPPQPPPPLAPLSNNKFKVKIENEDSDSTGNNSVASSTGVGHIGVGCVSSTEDGENSLNSFEGLLNGAPTLTLAMSEDTNDSNSKDSGKNFIIKKPLMLADLLEKKVDKDPPILNGVMGKELRIGDKGLELVEKMEMFESVVVERSMNHVDKVVVQGNEKVVNNDVKTLVDGGAQGVQGVPEEKTGVKRPASDCGDPVEAKRPHLSNNLNGVGSPAPDSVSSSNGDEPATASTAAAKLFADLAADILEDEDEEEMEEPPPEVTTPPTPITTQNVPQSPQNPQQTVVQQTPVFVDNQQMIVAQPRQIIVSQPSATQMVQTQMKTTTGQTVIVQNTAQQRSPIVQSGMGPILLSQGLQGLQGLPGLQGQVQLVPSGQPGQYVLQAAGAQGFVVTQHANSAGQAVLLTQAAQQQTSGTKTIIILQPNSGTPTHHQKVVVTPQGQQMVVTQMQRPVVQQSSVGTIMQSPSKSTTTTANGIPSPQPPEVKKVIVEPKIEVDITPKTVVPATTTTTTVMNTVKTKAKSPREMNALFICEWGDCHIETKFKSANQVYMHVCKAHVPDTNDELLCQWERCDNMKRKRFSLMTHINDKHCNLDSMKLAQIKRKHIQQTGKVDPPPPPQTTQHPGYAPDAAFHAIKRHALEFVNPKELQRCVAKQGAPALPRAGAASDQDDNEGPVTKSIRLTASLILRNLVIYSNNCRRYLKPYEPHLANVALSNVESSRTIAQVLYDMNDASNRR